MPNVPAPCALTAHPDDDAEASSIFPSHTGMAPRNTFTIRPASSARTRADGDTCNIAVSWSGPSTAVFTAQMRRGNGTFAPLTLSSANATRIEHRLVSSDRYRFRVRGTDRAGNTSAWAATSVRARLVQERAKKVRYDGRWVRDTVAGASGHRVRSSAMRGATATIRTSAETVDVVASTGPRRGKVAVLVDGRRARTVDLYSARPRHRQTVATLHGLSPQQRSVVQLRVLGTKRHASGGSGVTLDAFVLTR